jgi:effector-binding domain-containing protein/uncharacterized protein YndB with AHSA1/START domain
MKFLKGLLIFIVVVFVGYCIFMFFLPSSFQMERKITIEAQPAKVYNAVLDMQSWKNWSYWDKLDSTNEVSYFGTPGEVGSGYAWKGDPNKVGEGTFTVTALEENKRIDFDLAFMGQDPAGGYFTFEPIGEDETEVTYAFTAEFGFFDRIGKFFIEMALAQPYEESLAALKDYVESAPAPVTFTVEQVNVEAMPYYGIRDEIKIADMNSEFFATRYAELGAFLQEDMEKMTSPPLAFYELWDEENGKAVVVVAIATPSEKAPNERIIKGMTPSGAALKVAFYGPYEATGAAHEAIHEYAATNSIQLSDMAYEVYVTDPSTEPDPSKWLTEIYYPIAAADATTEETSEM